jgi:hypothetical protein
MLRDSVSWRAGPGSSPANGGAAWPEFRDRDLYLVKKSLAIAMLAIERQPGPLQPASDCQDMKTNLGDLVGNPAELAQFMRSALIAVTGHLE